MATIQATGIADVLIVSLNKLDRLKFTDLMSNYRDTIALKKIFKDKVKTATSPEFQFNIMTDTNGSFRSVGVGYVSQVDIPNVMTNGKMPFRHVTWNWAMDRKLVAMNSGEAKIIDIAMTQRLAGLGSAIIGFERLLWSCPSLADFDVKPVGIPYFVVKSSTDASTDTALDGFNGGAPSGYTLVANLTPATSANGRYRNYADAYSAVSKADLFRKVRRARFKTAFKALTGTEPGHTDKHDTGIYVNYDTCAQIEEELEAQNDNLGKDMAPMDGKAVFMGTSLTPVQALETDTTDPVYLLDWNELEPTALKTEWMREEHFKAEANQPTISMTNTDCSWNLGCRNRRKQSVIATATTMFDPP